jgi:hypothetical protein
MSSSRSITSQLQIEPDSVMADDGLRYKFKGGGSPFQDSANMSTMSCYRCGLHKSRSLGVFVRLLNQRSFVCQDCCNKPLSSSAQSGMRSKDCPI